MRRSVFTKRFDDDAAAGCKTYGTARAVFHFFALEAGQGAP